MPIDTKTTNLKVRQGAFGISMKMWTERNEHIGTFTSRLQWIANIKQHYLAMNPLEKWEFVRTIHFFVLRVIGAAFMDPNYKINRLTSIPIFLQANYYILLAYTIFHYRNDPFKALTATPALGFFVPGLILMCILLVPSSCSLARQGYDFAGVYIYKNSDITPKNRAACDRMAIKLWLSAINVTSLTLFSLALMAFAPQFKTLFTEEKEMMIPIILPFVDPDTENGFYLNLANQLVICYGGAFIVPGSELVSCVLKNNYTVMAAVIKNGLEEFNDFLENQEQFTENDFCQLRNIVLQILDFDRYVVGFNELLYWKFFLHPIFAMYSISVAVSSYLIYNWIAGIGAAACLYIQLLILCDMGQTVDNANSEILAALNQFSYNLLPPENRKLFALLLNRVQNGSKIQMGPLRQLSYETATKLTKMMYTYIMMMTRMIKLKENNYIKK